MEPEKSPSRYVDAARIRGSLLKDVFERDGSGFSVVGFVVTYTDSHTGYVITVDTTPISDEYMVCYVAQQIASEMFDLGEHMKVQEIRKVLGINT